MIIDGRAIAADILREAKEEMMALGVEPVVRAVVVAPSPATISYLNVKSKRAQDAGMRMEVVQLPDDAIDGDVIDAIRAPGADAVIVQLPLPDSLTTELILDEIPVLLDADVLSTKAYMSFVYRYEHMLLPPVVSAVREILTRENVSVEGKRAVTLGSGRLVGQPISVWLEQHNAYNTILTQESGDHSQLAYADIVISGTGSSHLIKPDMIKDGVVLIDAGTSESGGAIVGDADPACAEKASVFTPVPGGVGPIAVACLFRNVAALVKRGREIAK